MICILRLDSSITDSQPINTKGSQSCINVQSTNLRSVNGWLIGC